MRRSTNKHNSDTTPNQQTTTTKMRALQVLALSVLVLLVVADPPAKPAKVVRSLLQACRKEIPTLCKDRKDAMRCLTAKAAEVQDPVCATWLNARTTCNKFLQDSQKCAPKDNLRVCLRKLPKEDVPATCSDTDYYKSVRMFGSFRRRVSKAPSANVQSGTA